MCATQLIDEWFNKPNCIAAIKVDLVLCCHLSIGTNKLHIEKCMAGDGTVNKVCKCSKGNTAKKLVRYCYQSIPVIELALLDKGIHKYLLYLLLPMQLLIGKPLTLLDALLMRTETNKNG